MAPSLYPVIPETIRVHLGAPGSNAETVRVPFVDYIKNVVSSEIYPTWPESAIRANVYAITTYALNRIYTEWYPSRGYDFDITNSTRYDQAYIPDRDIFENISRIVDELFNDYVVKQGRVNPFFTQFCNGTTSTCNGLSQWGTVTLANEGLTPYEILKRYYGNDIDIVTDAPVASIPESFPGVLSQGDAGNSVEVLQEELNRISKNYPAIPKIPEPNGYFDIATENAVKAFQEIFNLNPTGVVDKSTWYSIKRYYTGVKNLAELVSEGVTLQEAELPFITEFSLGATGEEVRLIQYYLAVIAYFNGAIPLIVINGSYDNETFNAVYAFQTFYGLTPTGIVDEATWNLLKDVYIKTINSLPDAFYGEKAKLFPGYFLAEGMQNEDVEDLQTYLSFIADFYTGIPKIPVTGYFGSQTREAVTVFQRLFGITPNGIVGANTWNAIATQYDFLKETAL